ncbi:sporulation protein YpjB [Melghiribacillus thermohalophilus]|uniref:Sporulation protein YpjB n=1 Tax=Melghiribacillus thermohalophilus TaxID=1324956 RepID=A0A4R3N8A0_9BACI|nr:sporulation protein YpjB [Melghiribacillus thermohalophilus]TCT25561.1 sporulation protein YpjB [Melghiribacillus thermohalophilus]
MNVKQILYILLIGISLFMLTNEFHTVLSASKRQAVEEKWYQFIEFVESGSFKTAGNMLDEAWLNDILLLYGDLYESKHQYAADVFHQTKKTLLKTSVDRQKKMESARTLILMLYPAMFNDGSLHTFWKDKTTNAIYDALESHPDQFHEKFVRAATLYHQIFPSLVIQHPLDRLDQFMNIHSKLSVLMKNPDPQKQEKILFDMLRTMEETDHKEKEKENFSFLWMIFTIGGLIILTLMYASWKKYKGEKNREQDKKVDSDYKSD